MATWHRSVDAITRAHSARDSTFVDLDVSDLDLLRIVCESVGRRVFESPDSNDFLGWHAGTMEYWLHALIASEARRNDAWASRTEVPYITTARVQSSRGEKWSDGAICWPTKRVGALIEAKALVAHTPAKVRQDLRDKVAADLDALLGIDRAATIARVPGRYEDPGWSANRTGINRLYALQMVLIHGQAAPSCDDVLAAALTQGVVRVAARYSDVSPVWLPALQATYKAEGLYRRAGGDGPNAALLFAWAAPLPWVTDLVDSAVATRRGDLA